MIVASKTDITESLFKCHFSRTNNRRIISHVCTKLLLEIVLDSRNIIESWWFTHKSRVEIDLFHRRHQMTVLNMNETSRREVPSSSSMTPTFTMVDKIPPHSFVFLRGSWRSTWVTGLRGGVTPNRIAFYIRLHHFTFARASSNIH